MFSVAFDVEFVVEPGSSLVVVVEVTVVVVGAVVVAVVVVVVFSTVVVVVVDIEGCIVDKFVVVDEMGFVRLAIVLETNVLGLSTI